MNIGVVVHNYDRRDGTGGYTVELVSRFAPTHDVTVYAVALKTPPPAGVTVVRVPAVRSHGYATILTFPAAFRAVRRQHDVVHAQGWVTGRADVVTAHIVLAAWRDAARRAGGVGGRGERVFGGLVARREAALYRAGAERVIAPSRKIQAELARHYDRRERVHVIPHGFPPPAHGIHPGAARAALNLPPGAYLALYVGDARKGAPAALDAVALADDIHLVIVSHTPAGPLLERARTLGIAGRVHWLGAQRDIATVYAACDVLVHPTIYDAFGLVVAEAMAAGLPVIVSRHAGITELLSDGESGCVLQGDDRAEWAAALHALKDPQSRRVAADAARATAEARGWDAVATETLRVYEQVVAR